MTQISGYSLVNITFTGYILVNMTSNKRVFASKPNLNLYNDIRHPPNFAIVAFGKHIYLYLEVEIFIS